MGVELKPDNTSHGHSVSSPKLNVEDPIDFNEGGKEYRRNLLGTMALSVVLVSAYRLEPKLLGVELSKMAMWLFLGLTHTYFFVMWRLTSVVENDRDKKFLNVRGLIQQAFARGTKDFPGKTRAQIILIRAFPIWAFILGLLCILYSLSFRS